MSFESKGLKNAPTFACNDTKFSQKMTWAVKNLFVLFLLLKTSMLRAQFDPGIDTLELLHPMPTTEDSIRVKTLVTLPIISELIARTDTVIAKTRRRSNFLSNRKQRSGLLRSIPSRVKFYSITPTPIIHGKCVLS